MNKLSEKNIRKRVIDYFGTYNEFCPEDAVYLSEYLRGGDIINFRFYNKYERYMDKAVFGCVGANKSFNILIDDKLDINSMTDLIIRANHIINEVDELFKADDE